MLDRTQWISYSYTIFFSNVRSCDLDQNLVPFDMINLQLDWSVPNVILKAFVISEYKGGQC